MNSLPNLKMWTRRPLNYTHTKNHPNCTNDVKYKKHSIFKEPETVFTIILFPDASRQFSLKTKPLCLNNPFKECFYLFQQKGFSPSLLQHSLGFGTQKKEECSVLLFNWNFIFFFNRIHGPFKCCMTHTTGKLPSVGTMLVSPVHLILLTTIKTAQ